MKRLIFPLITLLFACTSEPTTSTLELPSEDFCAKIHRDSTISLSDHVASFRGKMSNQTGIYVLEEGDDAMVARAWLTENAEKTIDIQYFIYSTDNVGLIATDYLLRSADRGVKVRILVDDIMVDAQLPHMLALNEHENLSIKIYNPNINVGKNITSKLFNVFTDFREINQRMHNKTFTVDGEIVITGGRNIADEYFDYDHEYNFRDRDVLMVGGKSSKVQTSFDEFWNHELSIPLAAVVDADDYNYSTDTTYEWLHQYACNPENFWPQVREKIQYVPLGFDSIIKAGKFIWVDSLNYVSDDPGKNDGTKGLEGGGKSTAELIRLIKGAQTSIKIQSPYLITTNLGNSLFKSTIDKGVDVQILTNSLESTDNLEAFNGYMRVRNDLLDAGVDIYEFRPDAKVRYDVMTGILQDSLEFAPIFGLHAKSMVIDNYISVIGTFNLDPRSANLNTECVVVIYSKKIAEELSKAMDIDMLPENAWRTTKEWNPDGEASKEKQEKVKTKLYVPKGIL